VVGDLLVAPAGEVALEDPDDDGRLLGIEQLLDVDLREVCLG
jgi:hypothetical protein